MADPISSIRNLGPAVEAAFAEIGITTAQEVRDLGADEAYRRLLQGGKTRPHFIGYYVMVMGLQGVRGTIAKVKKRSTCASALMK